MLMSKKLLKTVACAFSLLLSSQFSAASAPHVLTTIKPLQLISQAITEGVTETDVLLPPGASPHSHSMRPSDARKLHSADVIFWVGPDMESFLTRSLPSGKNVKVVAMMDSASINLRKNEEDEESHHDHDHHDHHHHGHHHDHDHGEFDPHIWLSTDNGRAMARVMTKTLTELDKENASRYESNLQDFLKTLDDADERNKKKLTGLEKTPFFVFHDAYGYLQDQYGLQIGGYFTLTPEQQPGARHLSNLRNTLRNAGKTCIFREPQFQPAYIDRITEGLDVNVGVLDPLGEHIEPTPDGFARFINSLVDNIKDCMSS